MPKDDLNMHYVVIDTNVIVSALLAIDNQQSIPLSIVAAVFAGKITPILSPNIMDEYRDVLAREKFGFDQRKIELFLSELKTQSVFVNPPTTHKTLPDLKDLCFYEAANVYKDVGGLLVTGNIKHFPDCPFAITPAQLKEKLNL